MTWSRRTAPALRIAALQLALERLAAARHEVGRLHRRQAPILAEVIEHVGRRADARARSKQRPVRPGRGAVRRHANGEIEIMPMRMPAASARCCASTS